MKPFHSIALALAALATGAAQAQLVTYNPSSLSGIATSLPASGVNANITATDMTRGSGLTGVSASGGFNSSGFNGSANFAAAISNNDFYTFTIAPAANYSLSFTAVSVALQRSSANSSQVSQWGYSINSFASGLGTAVTIGTSSTTVSATLSNTGITAATEFRIVGWNGSSGGTNRVNPSATVTGTATLRTAGTLTWDGGQGNGNWNSYTGTAANQSNWNLNNIPASSLTDSLAFAGTTQATTNNNITGLTVASITFNSGAAAFTNAGNSLTLNGGITNSSSNLQTINHGIALSNAAHTIDSGSAGVTVGGAITGGGAGTTLTKNGAGTLTLSGTNTYTGGVSISAGTLALGTSGTLGTGGVAIGSGASLNISGRSTNYSLSGAVTGTGSIVTGTRTLTIATSLDPGTSTTVGTFTVNGNVTLGSSADTTFNIATEASFDTINLAAGTFTLDGDLRLDVSPSWTLAVGSYDFFTGAGSLSGDFDHVAFSGKFTGAFDETSLGSGIWMAVVDDTTFTFDASTGVLNITAVPEPHEYALAFAGLLAFVIIRRRMRRA